MTARIAFPPSNFYFRPVLYFDHNATSPMHPAAKETWSEAVDRYIGNPSSPHRVGDRADKALNEAREKLADLLGCHPQDIVWTSGATEANNLVIHHAAVSKAEFATFWTSGIEHPSVMEPMRHHFPKRNLFMPPDEDGALSIDKLKASLARRRPAILGLMASNNETGVVQPWQDALKACRENNVEFFCDATQWLGKRPADGLGKCDFVSGSAHKFGGPRGVGFLKCPEGKIEPLLRGGSQEEGRRAGTENVPGVLAMMSALELRESQLAKGEHPSRVKWRDDFIDSILEKLAGAELVGADADRMWNTVSVLMPQTDCQQRWVVKLDKAGFAVTTGSACASGKEEPSHVLTAMGHAPKDAGRVLRFSSGWETTEADWLDMLAGVLKVNEEMEAIAEPAA